MCETKEEKKIAKRDEQKKLCGCANARIKRYKKKHNKKNLRKKRRSKRVFRNSIQITQIFIQIKYNPFCSLTHSIYVYACVYLIAIFIRGFFHFLTHKICIYVK